MDYADHTIRDLSVYLHLSRGEVLVGRAMELQSQRLSMPVPVIEEHDDALATPRATLVQALRGCETAKPNFTQTAKAACPFAHEDAKPTDMQTPAGARADVAVGDSRN